MADVAAHRNEIRRDGGGTSVPGPAVIPLPTPAPFLLALGLTLLFWSLAASPLLSFGGLGLTVWALVSWISGLRRDWRSTVGEAAADPEENP